MTITKNNLPIPDLVIYQATNGAIELKNDKKNETVWASLDQITTVFGRDKSVVSRHIKNIYKDSELQKDWVVAFFATTANDGKTYQVEYFNLDMIIAVGYRVNSKRATQFRIWASNIIKEYITQGYTINKEHLQKNNIAYQHALDTIQALALWKNISSDNIWNW